MFFGFETKKKKNRAELILTSLFKMPDKTLSQEKVNFLNSLREQMSDRPARPPRVVLAIASHDSLRVRFLI